MIKNWREFNESVFTKNYNGLYPDYVEEDGTLTSYWHTLSPSVDKEIKDLLDSFIAKKISLKGVIEKFHQLEEVDEADISKETINPFIDCLIDISGESDEYIMKLYHNY